MSQSLNRNPKWVQLQFNFSFCIFLVQTKFEPNLQPGWGRGDFSGKQFFWFRLLRLWRRNAQKLWRHWFSGMWRHRIRFFRFDKFSRLELFCRWNPRPNMDCEVNRIAEITIGKLNNLGNKYFIKNQRKTQNYENTFTDRLTILNKVFSTNLFLQFLKYLRGNYFLRFVWRCSIWRRKKVFIQNQREAMV